MTSETLNKMNGSANDIAHNAGKKVGNMVSNFANSTNDQLEIGREYVSENPVKGIVIAAATGLVVGSLLTLAIRRK